MFTDIAKSKRHWCADRIVGEQLKVDWGQTGAQLLRNHADQIWGWGLLQMSDLFFRPLFAFFNSLLTSRKVIHVGVTRSPTDGWVARTAARSDSLWASAKLPDSG